jgi:hypothetical protein
MLFTIIFVYQCILVVPFFLPMYFVLFIKELKILKKKTNFFFVGAIYGAWNAQKTCFLTFCDAPTKSYQWLFLAFLMIFCWFWQKFWQKI